MKPLYKKDVFNNIIVAAHRGDQSNAPENSIESFIDAISSGVDMIEADIHITKDNHFIINHNAYIQKDSKKYLISELSSSEIQKIKVVNKKSSTETKIAKLSDLLSIAKNKCYLNIEIKRNNSITNASFIDKLLNEITKYGNLDEVLFASFYYDMLSVSKEIAPEVPIAAIRIPSRPLLPEQILSKINIDAYITSQSSLSMSISESALKNNIILATYSIDTAAHFAKAMKYNAKAIGTNRAKEIVEIANIYRKSAKNKP